MRASNIRNGNIIRFNNKYYRVKDFHHHTPGNLRAMVQTKLQDIMNGNTMDHRFRAEDDLELATVESIDGTYLYEEGDFFVVMDTTSYEQHSIAKSIASEVAPYLTENMEVKIDFIDGNPVFIQVPMTVVLEVVETEPAMKGATASNSNKPAKLNNGITVTVPPYIEPGTKIKVDTRTHTYIERV